MCISSVVGEVTNWSSSSYSVFCDGARFVDGKVYRLYLHIMPELCSNKGCHAHRYVHVRCDKVIKNPIIFVQLYRFCTVTKVRQ